MSQRSSRRRLLDRRREEMRADDRRSRLMLSLIIGAFVIAVGAILIKNKIASGPIDLNSAPASKLESLPGIGPETARAIVKGRPYETIEELDKVRGIGPATIEKLRDRVTAGD